MQSSVKIWRDYLCHLSSEHFVAGIQFLLQLENITSEDVIYETSVSVF